MAMRGIGPEVNMGGFDRILDFVRKDRPVKDWHAASREMKVMFPALSIRDEAGWLRMAREKPDLERASVPGVGHAPTLAGPAARNAVEQFLSGL